MSSQVLLINHSQDSHLEVGVDHAKSLIDAKKKLKNSLYGVISIVLDPKNFSSATSMLSDYEKNTESFKLLVTENNLDKDQIAYLAKNFSLEYISSNEKLITNERIIFALEAWQKLKQDKLLFKLREEEKQKLKSQTHKLHTKSTEQKNEIKIAIEKSKKINKRTNTLKHSLMTIHNAKSILEIEKLLAASISEIIPLSFVKIVYNDQIEMFYQRIKSLNTKRLYCADLSLSGAFTEAKVFYFSETGNSFRKEEISFLNQISEAINLAVDRLVNIQRSETLKQQWESTFDAISDSLCLCDSQYNILRTNMAFIQETEMTYEKVIKKNVFDVFFNIQTPKSKFDEFGKTSYQAQVHKKAFKKTYEVSVHSLFPLKLFLIIFRDITDQLKLEKQILENSKMHELGSISSSIAHELNNPIGGILSFLQLIKMDISPKDPIFNDIKEMETATLRCKSIVENLLGFSRQAENEGFEEIDLNEIISKSIDILNIKVRSKNTEIINITKNLDFRLTGNKNQLVQVFINLIQNSLEATENTEEPKIEISSKKKNQEILVHIKDNGSGISKINLSKIFNPLFSTKRNRQNNGLGLTVAYMILTNHKANLQFNSEEGLGTEAKITFRSLD